MRKLSIIVAPIVALLLVGAAHAGLIEFRMPLDGAQEAPGPGDPDGSGLAILRINPGQNIIDWDISVADILLPLTGAHIHQAPAGIAGPVVVNFNAQLSGSGLIDPDLASVLANPTGFYVNVHNTVFPGGAIRGQLPPEGRHVPEPATLLLLGLGLAGVGAMARRARARQA